MDSLKFGKAKRQAFAPFIPVLAITIIWPSVVYTGPNGATTLTAPTVAFPTPPATPLSGSFPKRYWNPEISLLNEPTVAECSYPFDPNCLPVPYLAGNESNSSLAGFGGNPDENWAEAAVICLVISSTTSITTTITSITTATQATESPLETGDPAWNDVECYNGGEKTEHVRMESAANSFCDSISKSSLKKKLKKTGKYPFDYNGGFGTVTITVSLEILYDICEFIYDEALCKKYLSVPIDSCDCSGINDKHGGKVINDCYEWRIDPQLSA
ncbi:hypothetical protein BKA65DRAFT_485864 [Rhexocercosporidium sp. MPI-PUGE-AT-0058]|nr:hypothetical protein BKA65DRAFT_485864 [Rhexocercosporidium sp. MPI-PUGE-AT-0058]